MRPWSIQAYRTLISYTLQSVHLIVLVGFEPERAIALIEKYEPAKVSLGYGLKATATDRKHYPVNLHSRNTIKLLYPDAEIFSFLCNDPYETNKAIKQQVSKFPGYNVVIAPMNTKISTLGAALCAFENETIQIEKLRPVEQDKKP